MLAKPLAGILLALSMTLIASQAAAEPDGWGSQKFSVEQFERVYFKGNAQLHLVQKPALHNRLGRAGQIAIRGAPRSLEHLLIESVDGVLYIDAGDRQSAHELIIHLAVSQLKEVVSEGRGQIFGDGLTSHSLAIEGRGAGQFNLRGLRVADLTVIGNGETSFQVSGAAQHQFVDLGGVGRYMARELASQVSLVIVRGAGQVDIWVEEVLDVSVLGTARVRYSGKPWVSKQISDTGALDHLLRTSS